MDVESNEREEIIPSRIEDERAVIAYVIMEGGAPFYFKANISPEHFHLAAHQIIWRIFGNHFQDPNAPLNAKAIVCLLSDNGSKWVYPYLTGCLEGAVCSEAIADWQLNRIRESYRLREVVKLSSEATKLGLQRGADYKEVVGLLDEGIDGIRSEEEPEVHQENELEEVVREARTPKSNERYIKTGIAQLNDFMNGGLRPGNLYLVAGRPGEGKSILALQLMNQAVNVKFKVNFHSLEMGRKELFQRWLSHRSEIPFKEIQSGNCYDPKLDVEKRNIHSKLKLARIFEKGSQDCSTIREEIYRYKPNLVVVDYVQLVALDPTVKYNKNQSRDREISFITNKLKQMARDNNLAVVALSALNRDMERRGGKDDSRVVPQLSDLRESGGLEADSDMVMILWRPKTPDPHDIGGCKMRIAKNRNGLTGIVHLILDGEHMIIREHA